MLAGFTMIGAVMVVTTRLAAACTTPAHSTPSN